MDVRREVVRAVWSELFASLGFVVRQVDEGRLMRRCLILLKQRLHPSPTRPEHSYDLRQGRALAWNLYE